MKRLKLCHPWWMNLPAVLVYLAFLGQCCGAAAPADIRCTAAEIPHWQFVLIFLVSPAVAIIGGFFWDELWARREIGKQSNSIATFWDEYTVGMLTMYALSHFFRARSIIHLARSFCEFHVWYGRVAPFITFVLEAFRRWNPPHVCIPDEDINTATAIIKQVKERSTHWAYWEVQRPVWYVVIIALMLIRPLFFT